LDASLKFALQKDHLDGCCGPPAGPVGGCFLWPPYPCPALFVTTDRQIDRQTDSTVAFTYKIGGYFIGS